MDAQLIIQNLLQLKDVRLPVIPEAMLKANQVMRNPDATTRDLVTAINNPTTVTRVLQVANSPALRRRPVSTINDAVSFLGMDLTRNIVVCAAMRDLFSCRNLFLGKKVELVWQHSAEIASVAAVLAKRFNTPVGPVMTAGMLHDIGVLPIVDYFDRSKCNTDLFDEVVASVGAHLGENILKRWDFPDYFIGVAHAGNELPFEKDTCFALVSAAHYIVDTNVERLTPLGLSPDEFLEIVSGEERLSLLSDML
jgi:HD-like signal output (HDOD) protein